MVREDPRDWEDEVEELRTALAAMLAAFCDPWPDRHQERWTAAENLAREALDG